MLEVIHKGVTFAQDSMIKNRLNFNGGCCDIPTKLITGLRTEGKYIVIECVDETYKLIYKGPKDWTLSLV